MKAILRILLVIVGVALAVALVVVLLGPFLISTEPASGLGPPRAAALPDSRFVTLPFAGTDGIDIHYLSQGAAGKDTDDPTFVLLHGFTFNAFTWNHVLPYFAARGPVFAYDQVPYGLSAKLTRKDWSGPNPYSREAASAHLFAFMDRLGIERATLVANSSGGTLALEAALAWPERIERLILVAPWVFAERPTIPGWLARSPQMRRLSLLVARQLGQGRLLEISYARPERIEDNQRSLTLAHTRVEDWDVAWGELLNLSLTSPIEVGARLGEVDQPVLVLTGDQDKLVAPAASERVAAELPRGSFEVLPNCGHVAQEECPLAFIDAVSDWLKPEAQAVAGN